MHAPILAAAAAMAATVHAALPPELSGWAQEVVLLGAAAAVLRAAWVRVLRPFAQLVHRALRAYEHLEQLPGFLDDIDERLTDVEGQVAGHNSALEVLLNLVRQPPLPPARPAA
jgi:hypothetical protein